MKRMTCCWSTVNRVKYFEQQLRWASPEASYIWIIKSTVQHSEFLIFEIFVSIRALWIQILRSCAAGSLMRLASVVWVGHGFGILTCRMPRRPYYLMGMTSKGPNSVNLHHYFHLYTLIPVSTRCRSMKACGRRVLHDGYRRSELIWKFCVNYIDRSLEVRSLKIFPMRLIERHLIYRENEIRRLLPRA